MRDGTVPDTILWDPVKHPTRNCSCQIGHTLISTGLLYSTLTPAFFLSPPTSLPTISSKSECGIRKGHISLPNCVVPFRLSQDRQLLSPSPTPHLSLYSSSITLQQNYVNAVDGWTLTLQKIRSDEMKGNFLCKGIEITRSCEILLYENEGLVILTDQFECHDYCIIFYLTPLLEIGSRMTQFSRLFVC